MKKSVISTCIGSSAIRVGELKAIELVAKVGFDAYDFSMCSNITKYDWGERKAVFADHPLAGDNYVKFVKEMKKVADDNGIFCNQSHAPFPTYNKLVFDNLKRAIECTAIAGGKICIVHPDNNKSAKENAELYQKILPFAKEHGVKIATENMWNWDKEKGIALPAACSHHDDFLAHIKEIDDENFVACLDIGHSEMAGLNTSAVQMIKTLGAHLQALHIHDNDKKHDSHWIPFSKSIDFEGVIKALKEIDYKGDFTLECDAYIKGSPDVEKGLREIHGAVCKIVDMFNSI